MFVTPGVGEVVWYAAARALLVRVGANVDTALCGHPR